MPVTEASLVPTGATVKCWRDGCYHQVPLDPDHIGLCPSCLEKLREEDRCPSK